MVIESTFDRVMAWASCYSSVRTVEIEWDRESLVLRPGSVQFDRMRHRELFRARWPDAWLVATGPLARDLDPPQDVLTSYVYADFGVAGRSRTEANRDLARGSFEVSSECPTIDKTSLLFAQGAPVLVGTWLWSLRDQRGAIDIAADDSGLVRITTKGPVRSSIVLWLSDEAHESELRSVTIVSSTNKPIIEFAFSNFSNVDGLSCKVPRSRTTKTFQVPENYRAANIVPPDRSDFISKVVVNDPSLLDSDFAVNLENLEDRSNPTLDAKADLDTPIRERPPERNSYLRLSNLIAILLIFACIALIVATRFRRV